MIIEEIIKTLYTASLIIYGINSIFFPDVDNRQIFESIIIMSTYLSYRFLYMGNNNDTNKS